MTAAPFTPPSARGVSAPRGLRRITRELARRLAQGEHLVLWGPTGSGKTTLVATIQRHLAIGVCSCATVTQSLDDITQALERAYPTVPTDGISRRAARMRLWDAADRERAVLLLDKVTRVSTAMKGFLRRLRGGIAGVLLVFDIDSPRERARLRAQHLGCLSVRIPALPSRVQRRLLAARWPINTHPHPDRATCRLLIRAARGRPGWIVACSQLAREPRYWCADALKVRAPSLDTELKVRALKLPLCVSEGTWTTPASNGLKDLLRRKGEPR